MINKMLKYTDFLTEKAAYDMILESKLVFSKKFISFLNKMKDNDLSKSLLSLYTADVNTQHNYIDVGTEKDTVSFTPERKIKELEDKGGKTDLYSVIEEDRYLTNSNGNSMIFELLGYEKGSDTWNPPKGTKGIIIKEVISPRSGKIFIWFKGIDENDGMETVLNKEAVELSGDSILPKVWSTSRNNIKIGRLVRAILSSTGKKFTDKEIEDFVNRYKSTYDVFSNALIRFDIVSGQDIADWYNISKYTDGDSGTLGNSCMANSPEYYFNIYVRNKSVCQLIIFYDENGKMVDGKYTSDRILGRCLLWTANDGKKIMDRIYVSKDSDIDLFKEFGKKNGFYWKRSQDSENVFTLQNGVSSDNDPSIIIDLEDGDFDHYPYLDTFFYLDMGSDKLSNDSSNSYSRMLRDTSGGYDT